ncbi:MAG TPA: aminotransferase [Micromonosporaceae bacterium]|nr:aminotransferase [Micromonosporaceae bacterium]
MIPGARDLFVLDPSVAHLNHGSFGAIPKIVRAERQRLLDEFDANPLRLVTGDLWERTAAARRQFADFLGAEPELSALVGNATQGMAIVLNSLDLRPGDEIVITDHSYNAFTLAVQDQGARRGVKMIVAPIDLELPVTETVATITSLVNERTKLVIVDQISSATAQLHPVAEIAAALRPLGVPLLVDGAHAPGMLHKPLAGINADFWVGNLHKWAFAPSGTALLRVSSAWRDRMVPLAVSHGHAEGYPKHLEQQGTRDFSTWLAAVAGLTLFEQFGEVQIQRHNVDLAAYGQRVVGEALGVDPEQLPNSGDGVSMRIIPLPAGVADDYDRANPLRRRIADELGIEVAVNAWRGRGWLRISGQIYNTEDECDRLAAALPALLKAAA